MAGITSWPPLVVWKPAGKWPCVPGRFMVRTKIKLSWLRVVRGLMDPIKGRWWIPWMAVGGFCIFRTRVFTGASSIYSQSNGKMDGRSWGRMASRFNAIPNLIVVRRKVFALPKPVMNLMSLNWGGNGNGMRTTRVNGLRSPPAAVTCGCIYNRRHANSTNSQTSCCKNFPARVLRWRPGLNFHRFIRAMKPDWSSPARFPRRCHCAVPATGMNCYCVIIKQKRRCMLIWAGVSVCGWPSAATESASSVSRQKRNLSRFQVCLQ